MLASNGEITEPCPVPLSLTETTPSSRMPAFSHFWIRRMMRRSPIRCSRKRTSHSQLISSQNDRMSAPMMQWTRSASGSVAEPEEVFLVDRVQHRGHRPLDNLVFQRCDRERALPAIRLGDVDPPARQCPIGSPLDPSMQVLEIALKVCLVVVQRKPIYARRTIRLEFEERFFEHIDVDVVEERGEPLLLPFSRDFPYAFQRL